MSCKYYKFDITLWQYEALAGAKNLGKAWSFLLFRKMKFYVYKKCKTDSLTLREIQKSIQKVSEGVVLSELSNCQNKK